VEVTAANVEQVRDFVFEVRERFPGARVVALLTTDVLAAERLLSEAGAVDVIGSVLEAPRVARMARRMAAQTLDVELSVRELAEQTLPWPALATPEWKTLSADRF
jgi:hypothetical protein